MSDPLPSRTRPRGSEALGEPERIIDSEAFIIEQTEPVAPGTVFLLLGIVALAVGAIVIAASRSPQP